MRVSAYCRICVDISVVTAVCGVGAEHRHDVLLVGPDPGQEVQVGSRLYFSLASTCESYLHCDSPDMYFLIPYSMSIDSISIIIVIHEKYIQNSFKYKISSALICIYFICAA